MNVYPDSSFLYSLYILDKHSKEVAHYIQHLNDALPITGLLHFEFSQAVRFAIARKGVPEKAGLNALAKFEEDISSGVLINVPCNWAFVHHTASRLSAHYTIQRGYRTLDILHVSTALTLGAKGFLTFDRNQSKLAHSEGLVVPW